MSKKYRVCVVRSTKELENYLNEGMNILFTHDVKTIYNGPYHNPSFLVITKVND